jgi:hypothetical protein
MGNIVDVASRPALLNGFADDELHPQIVEALKVLSVRQEEHRRALNSLDTQYLKALEASNDGDSLECRLVLAQVDAVRDRF